VVTCWGRAPDNNHDCPKSVFYPARPLTPRTGGHKFMTSPVPFLTDAQYTALPLHERALMVAVRECDIKGVREIGNTNRGKEVEEYLAYVGLGGGYAWCAGFVSWCLGKAGFTKFKSARVFDWVKWGKRTGRVHSKPTRGCLFAYLNKDGTGHIGFVTAAKLGVFLTIEGNTNDVGSREGYKVCRRSRVGSKYVFINVY
jgi:hypothetical protein